MVRNGGGSILAARPSARGRVLLLPIRRSLEGGTYTVRWSIISDDGHNELGVFAFSIGLGPVAAPSLQAGARIDRRVVATRWLFLTCLLAGAGLALFEVLVARRSVGSFIPARLLAGFLAGTAAAGGLLVSLSGAGGATRFGLATLVGSGVAAAGAVAALAGPPAAGLALALAILPVPTLAGHALDAGRSWIEVPLDLVHVLAAAFWLGSLIALALVAAHPRRSQTGRRAALMRFSRLALPTVAVLASTGAGRALAELSRPAELWTTGYGATLVAKTALLGVLLALAVVSRRALADSPKQSVLPIRTEAGVLVLLLLAVAVLTTLAPARTRIPPPAAAQREGKTALTRLPAPDAVVLGVRDGGYVAALAVRPSGEARVNFIAQDTKAVDVGAVEIDGRPTRSCGAGCYAGTAPRHGAVTVTHPGRTLRFDLGRPRAAPTLVAELTETYRRVRGIAYTQSIASGVGTRTVAVWRETPDGFSYRLANGNEAIAIGSTRWERARGTTWTRSRSTRASELVPPWGTEGPFSNAHILGRRGSRVVLSFLGADPGYPAWFSVTADVRSRRVVAVRMTAAAHFMEARYLRWNAPIVLRPPSS